MRRFAFSSTGNPIRSVGTVVVQKESSFVWWLTSAAESLFARPVPAACPFPNLLPVRLSPLPLGEPFPAAAAPIAPGFGSISGDRRFRNHSRSAAREELRCGLGWPLQPLFDPVVVQRPPVLGLDCDRSGRRQGPGGSRRSAIRSQRSGGRGGPGIGASALVATIGKQGFARSVSTV